MEDPKHICDVENEKCVLEVWECGCGFHLGLDASYLDQIGDLEVPCPNCGNMVKTERGFVDEDAEGWLRYRV